MKWLVSHPNLPRDYRAHAGVILETWFHPEILIPKLRARHAQIREALAEDPFPPRPATNPTDRGCETILAGMETFIRATDFANAIGPPGPGITTATEHNVEPGKTYRYRAHAVLPTLEGPQGTGVSKMITVRVPEK